MSMVFGGAKPAPVGGLAPNIVFLANMRHVAGSYPGQADPVTQLSDVELAAYKALGIDEFVCTIQWLNGLGGTQEFTIDPGNPLTASKYALQKHLVDTNFIARAAAVGINIRLAFNLHNYFNLTTPLAPWHEEPGSAGWLTVFGAVANIVEGARYLGFSGLAMDAEMYLAGPTWSWNYSGNPNNETTTRAKVQERGAQLVAYIATLWPDVSIMEFGSNYPTTWAANVQFVVNGISNAYANLVYRNFWTGMVTNPGIWAVESCDEIFYRGSQIDTIPNALAYEAAAWAALCSTYGWPASRFKRYPFAWIDEGPNLPTDVALTVAEAAEIFQLYAAGRDRVHNFAWNVRDFNYAPYAPPLRLNGETS